MAVEKACLFFPVDGKENQLGICYKMKKLVGPIFQPSDRPPAFTLSLLLPLRSAWSVAHPQAGTWHTLFGPADLDPSTMPGSWEYLDSHLLVE